MIFLIARTISQQAWFLPRKNCQLAIIIQQVWNLFMIKNNSGQVRVIIILKRGNTANQDQSFHKRLLIGWLFIAWLFIASLKGQTVRVSWVPGYFSTEHILVNHHDRTAGNLHHVLGAQDIAWQPQ